MRRVIVIAVVALAAAPAAASGACTEPARVIRTSSDGATRTSVRACGRIFAFSALTPRGGRIALSAASAPGRIAWVELRRGRRFATLRAVVAAEDGHRLRTVALGRGRARTLPRVPLVVTTRGDVAALVGGRVLVDTVGGHRSARAGSSELRLEDDRTVTWMQSGGGLRVQDLTPRIATPGTCPARTAYAEIARTPQIVVTQKEYDDEGHYATVVRACVIAQGIDRIMRIARNGFDSGEIMTAIGASGTAVVMTSFETGDRYDTSGACTRKIIVRDASGFPTIFWNPFPCTDASSRALAPGVPLAVTADRQVAWVETTEQGQQLTAITGMGPKVLDPAGPGTITDLRADGQTVGWKRDGAERSATL